MESCVGQQQVNCKHDKSGHAILGPPRRPVLSTGRERAIPGRIYYLTPRNLSGKWL